MPSDEWDAKAREFANTFGFKEDSRYQMVVNTIAAFGRAIDTAAERRGIERAAKWHDRNAEACKTLIAEGFEVEANAREYAFHKNAADHLCALAPPMADAGPMEPAGASDREGT